MKQTRSIAFQLFLVYLFFFFITIVLGLFSIERLSNFNHVSADVRDLWLPNTRFLGDLNNFTSDFRAAEGTNLLARTPAEFAANLQEIKDLDRSIAEAERGYERVSHSAGDIEIYVRFRNLWDRYRQVAGSVIAPALAERRADAVQIYLTESRTTYSAASDALTQLTDRNVSDARQASERSDLAYGQARLLIGVAIAIAGLLTIGALLHVRRSLSVPLFGLAEAMRRLARNQMNIEISGTDRDDEIGEMARSVVVFRNNAIDLALAQRSLSQQASMLEEKLLHERRLAELQRNFVSMASHEFRTPLTIIDGHARRLAATSDGAPEINQRSEKIRRAVLRITNLIDGLLNSTRIIEGELYFHPTGFELAPLLREVCQLHREMTPGAQILESFTLEHGPIEGDPKLLAQVFGNLLSNAIKYSPGGGVIKVAARSAPDEVTIEVEDHGIGIPAADVERLFTRYFRGSNVSGIVGTGVGLYLVKIVVDLHGGTIAVDSREGQGTRFTIVLPMRSPARNVNPDMLADAGK